MANPVTPLPPGSILSVRVVQADRNVFISSATTTIKELQEWISARQGVPIERQVLFIGSRKLDANPADLLGKYLGSSEYIQIRLKP